MMDHITDTIEKTKLKRWIKELRDNRQFQVVGKYAEEGKFCAVGLFIYANPVYHGSVGPVMFTALETGLPPYVVREVMEMNDTGTDFNDIADYLEDYV